MILEVTKLRKDFGGLRALDDVSFALEEGIVLGLIGPNGSGKTTLFNCMAGFYKPTSGSVVFQGKDITGYPPYKVCKAGMARTFQLNRPFSDMTVVENVMVTKLCGSDPVGSLKWARAESEELLEFTGLSQKHHMKAGQLGIIDRKRVEVARALGAGPKVLLLDEMMAGLNLKEIEEAMELVRSIRKSGVTVIIVEHIMKALLGVSDRVIVLSAGGKICEGAPAEITCNQQVIEAYLGEYRDA
jgi:branched-chain amino acid transport system ATP-binding protein